MKRLDKELFSPVYVDRAGNLWEVEQQSDNLFLCCFIDDKEDETKWCVVTKGVLEVM